ncbi:Hypothetical_protein [Hexamita inflata]|uniref:Hypothetical_protein n=1 Tax=Hexamita inflata TaxID=28002 RepID=A0ABP1H6H0_9EUKA
MISYVLCLMNCYNNVTGKIEGDYLKLKFITECGIEIGSQIQINITTQIPSSVFLVLLKNATINEDRWVEIKLDCDDVALQSQYDSCRKASKFIEAAFNANVIISSKYSIENFPLVIKLDIQKKQSNYTVVIVSCIVGVFALMALLGVQLWEVELLFLVYYVSNYILKYFATSNADDKFQYIISSWRLFMNYSLTQEGQKYDFDRIRPQSTIQSRYLIFQKGKIEITTCIKGRQ